MAKLNKYDQRVLLPKGVQKSFIESVQFKLNANLDDLANRIGVHRRTLFDWRREKFLISKSGIKKLSKLSGITIPSKVKIKNPFWYTNLGAKKGWVAVLKKYGRVPINEEYRKKKWYEWWEKEGKFKKHPIINICKPFNKPAPSKELAEFVGIMMGDGGMTPYQICITLHHIDDLEFSKYVVSLIKKLFKVVPSVIDSPKDSVNDILVSRSGLVRYLNSLGLVIGNKVKQQFDIPGWIKRNDGYLGACIRGLVDTDGCLIQHNYKVNNKMYCYKKLSFTTLSTPLRMTVFKTLKKWGFNARISQDRDVRLDSIMDMKKYFEFIGSNNQKHLKKYYD